MELKIQSLLSRENHTLSKSLHSHGWSTLSLGLSRREEITDSKFPHCAHWRSPQNRPLSSRGKFNSLPISNQLQKEDRDSVLCRLDKVFKSNGIVNLVLKVRSKGIFTSVISRLWQRFQDDSNVSRCYSTGRPRVITPNENRYLAVTAKRNRRSTASDLSRQLSSATITTVSRQTVYRRLGHIGLYARRSVRCVPLTATNCHLRLTWSREDALWTPQQWSCVMFSDESRFSLQSDSRRTLIWRVPGTRYHQENTIERHRYGGAGWLAFGEELFLIPGLTCMFRV
ncbi:HTH_Tnp_Tc3_2 domain-containing protein [Trichonephila clavipes]|nr:HTH_Tnp_Tc3_2 domain-containing protein [Trichonephila clavipes]